MIRKTKFIATLGPATDSPEMLTRLIGAGVDVLRLNMSHATHDWVRRIVPQIRSIAAAAGRHTAILLDTQGPGIRTGDLPAKIHLSVGDRFVFTCRGEAVPADTKGTTVGYDGFASDVQVGRVLVVDNGEFKMRVLAKTASCVECEVLTEGDFGSRRHINLPGVRVSLPALTDKDKADIAVGLELHVDFIALSFVRDPEDIEQLRAMLPQKEAPQIVAKIEHQFAVDHFEAIARAADVIMVARGDLGIECPYEELPIIQRRIVKVCQRIGRPVIVATQMLESMIHNPTPTRAEITDVANAVYEQADAIMLSGETTVGRYPLGCVEVMDTIARRIERSGGAGYHQHAELSEARQKLVKRAVELADDLRAPAVVIFTRGGRTAATAAWMRPHNSHIHAFTASESVARSLALCRAVTAHVQTLERTTTADAAETAALATLVAEHQVPAGAPVVIVTNFVNSAGVDRAVEGIRMRNAV